MAGNHCNHYSFGVLLMAVLERRKEVLLDMIFKIFFDLEIVTTLCFRQCAT